MKVNVPVIRGFLNRNWFGVLCLLICGYLLIGELFEKPTPPNNDVLIDRLNDLEQKVENHAEQFNSAANRLDSLEVKLEKSYATIDTLTAVSVPADISDFKLRAGQLPPKRFN